MGTTNCAFDRFFRQKNAEAYFVNSSILGYIVKIDAKKCKS
jgi:hypothetical protein